MAFDFITVTALHMKLVPLTESVEFNVENFEDEYISAFMKQGNPGHFPNL